MLGNRKNACFTQQRYILEETCYVNLALQVNSTSFNSAVFILIQQYISFQKPNQTKNKTKEPDYWSGGRWTGRNSCQCHGNARFCCSSYISNYIINTRLYELQISGLFFVQRREPSRYCWLWDELSPSRFCSWGCSNWSDGGSGLLQCWGNCQWDALGLVIKSTYVVLADSETKLIFPGRE